MKNFTFNNLKKATALVVELFKEEDNDKATKMALNAFSIYGAFKNQYRDVESVIYEFYDKERMKENEQNKD